MLLGSQNLSKKYNLDKKRKLAALSLTVEHAPKQNDQTGNLPAIVDLENVCYN